MTPCGTSYHVRCFRAGTPFTSRHRPGQSLSLPALEVWPNFACELCTVRAVLQRELGHPGDRWLLQLERVRIIDTFHHWSDGSLKAYQGSLRKVLRFERSHPGLHLLTRPTAEPPPRGRDIGLMWVQLHTSVQLVSSRLREEPHLPSFGTVRQIRSATSHFLGCTLVTERSGGDIYFQDRRLLMGPVRETDGAAYELFSRGLQARLGDHSTPSTALLARHVRTLDSLLTPDTGEPPRLLNSTTMP